MDKEKTYILEYWTNAGKFYKEFTRAEAIEYIKSQPNFLTRQVENIIEICQSTLKHENKWLRYDIDVIQDDAERLLTTLKLLGYEN